MTLIELTDAEAALFLLFRKYQEEFTLLLDNQVFQLKNGSAEIHFNPQGDIASIDLHAKVFRRIEIPSHHVDTVKKIVA